MPSLSGLMNMRRDVDASGGLEVVVNGVRVAFGHLFEGVPAGDSAEGALHVRVDNLKAVDIGRIYPAESGEFKVSVNAQAEQRWPGGLPFSGNAFEVGALIAIFGFDLVR